MSAYEIEDGIPWGAKPVRFVHIHVYHIVWSSLAFGLDGCMDERTDDPAGFVWA